MIDPNLDEQILIQNAAAGDRRSQERLFTIHRDRLIRMINVRMDSRLAKRLDASDVVQEALIEAVPQLEKYARDPKVPLFPWLRQITWQKLLQLQRRHLRTQMRSVNRERSLEIDIMQQSHAALALRFTAENSTPSQAMMREELQQQVQSAIGELADKDREILVLRHLERLSVNETATILGMTTSNVKVRHFRAVQRLQRVLEASEL